MKRMLKILSHTNQSFFPILSFQNHLPHTGADLGFSLEGKADFAKKFEKIVDLFFKVDQNYFPSSPKALRKPCTGQIFCAAGNKLLKKKTDQKGVLTYFFGKF